MLLLFDIDATLITTSRAGITALSAAGRDLLGPAFTHEGVDFAGRLDPLIITDLLVRNGMPVTPEHHAAMRAGYARHLTATLATPGLGTALPGVLALLSRLESQRGLTLGLLTGNFPETGRIKLHACGIDPARFPIHVWGDESPNQPPHRSDLPPIALDRESKRRARPLAPTEAWIIGDTPHDVAAAQRHGLHCLGVATGQYSQAALAQAGADIVVSDLSETDRIVDFLSQPSRPR